jgi:hypothetical protein
MTLDEIDAALAQWRQDLALSGTNIAELEETRPYQRLKGRLRANPPTLAGVTLAKASAAVAAAAELWQKYLLLTDLVQRAQDRRAQIGRLRLSDAALAEISEMLNGPSISLTAGATPLDQRDLDTPAQAVRRIAPAALYAEMKKAFAEARQVVAAIEMAQTTLRQEIAERDGAAAALQARIDAQGEGSAEEVRAARDKIAERRAALESDPLGVGETLAREVAPLLDAARARIETIDRERAETAQAIAEARARLASIKAQNAECAALETAARQRIVETGQLRPPLDAAVMGDLEGWLATIEATTATGKRRAALVGCSRWREAADGHAREIERARQANKAPLDLRAELRGRLEALGAKEAAYAKRGRPASAAARGFAEAARAQLYTRPTNLAEAARLVAAYESALAQSIAAPLSGGA